MEIDMEQNMLINYIEELRETPLKNLIFTV